MSAKNSFNIFLSIFKELYDKWFLHDSSKKCKNLHTKSEWITIGLAKSCETKNKLYLKWRKNRSVRNWNDYQNYKRKLDKIIAKAKYDYYDNKFSSCKSDLKKTWSNINQILGRKRRNRLLTFNSPDAPHNFNKYFTSIASNLINKNYPGTPNSDSSYCKYLKPNTNKFNDIAFDIMDLEQFIANLNNSKCTYFSPKVIKGVSNKLCPILIQLFNKC